jgi:hypothetical protein
MVHDDFNPAPECTAMTWSAFRRPPDSHTGSGSGETVSPYLTLSNEAGSCGEHLRGRLFFSWYLRELPT